MKCNHCGENLEGDEVKCCGCSKCYHFGCSISEPTYRAKSKEARDKWRCVKCREKGKQSSIVLRSTRRGSSGSIVEDLENSDLDSELDSIDKTYPGLKNILNKILHSINFMSNSFDNMTKKFEELLEENSKLKSEMKIMRETIEKKDDTIDSLTARINRLEQYKRRKYLEIHGIDTIEPNVNKQFDDIASSVGADQVEIKSIQRIKLAKSNMLMVKFKQESDRNDFILKGKTWSKNRRAENEGKKVDFVQMYFNESLIPEYRHLYRELRIRSKVAGIKYVWVKHGRILARKDDNSKIFLISSEKDFAKIV